MVNDTKYVSYYHNNYILYIDYLNIAEEVTIGKLGNETLTFYVTETISKKKKLGNRKSSSNMDAFLTLQTRVF